MGSIRQGLASNEKEDRKKEPIANEANGECNHINEQSGKV